MISLDKKYKTKSGLKVALYAVLPDNPTEKVQGAIIFSDRTQMGSWTLDGCFHPALVRETPLDLIEVSPYEDWKIDDKVIFWNNDGKFDNIIYEEKGYFAGLDHKGRPTVFNNGATSWSNMEARVTYDKIVRVKDRQ